MLQYIVEKAVLNMKTDMPRPEGEPEVLREGVIAGRNAVLEALKGKAGLEKIYIAKGENQGSILRIIALAREGRIPITEADRLKLQAISGISTHQGVVAYLKQVDYCEVGDILAVAKEREEPPLIVVCDELVDPHNLGAVIRTAEAAGAHGIIIPRHRGVGVTPAVTKSAAGAVFHMKIAKVTNLVRTLEDLKKQGVWIYGTDMAGDRSIFDTDLTGPCALVVGSEGEGMSRLVRETCDFLISIPMRGKVNSLNASVAAAIVLYEAVRGRR